MSTLIMVVLTLKVISQLGSAVMGGLAAWYWFRSAAKPAPNMTWGGINYLTPWLNKMSRLNRMAAGLTGASAALMTIATVCGFFV
jgi:hypothetical protein